MYVESGHDFPELAECFGGQQNGLCGGSVPGTLFLITGLHTGEVGFAVERHDAPPPLDETWQEIVEVSFRPAGKAALVGWAGQWFRPLHLAGADYRVRYSAKGMDEGAPRTPGWTTSQRLTATSCSSGQRHRSRTR